MRSPFTGTTLLLLCISHLALAAPEPVPTPTPAEAEEAPAETKMVAVKVEWAPASWENDLAQFRGFRIKQADLFKPRFVEDPIVASPADLAEFMRLQDPGGKSLHVTFFWSVPQASNPDAERELMKKAAALLKENGTKTLLPSKPDGTEGTGWSAYP
jgi:hypothetical protein